METPHIGWFSILKKPQILWEMERTMTDKLWLMIYKDEICMGHKNYTISNRILRAETASRVYLLGR